MINSFSDLIRTATEQQDAQRMLLLFASAEPEGKSPEQASDRGTLTPVMCVDKLPVDIKSFKELVAEADAISADWNMIFVAGLSGRGQLAPSEKDAEPYLNKMTSDVKTGQDLSQYLAFDRSENLLVFDRQ